MSGILLLNGDFSPMSVIQLKRGIGLVLAGKAEVIEESDEPLRSANLIGKVPSVLRLNYWVKVPYRSTLKLNKKALRARDKDECQFIDAHGPCKALGTTIDHVHPRSKGGQHEWTNVVWSCESHNSKKADKSLEQMGWTLKKEPKAPKGLVWFYAGIAQTDEVWSKYIPVAAV